MRLQKLNFRKLPTQQNLNITNPFEVLDLIYSGFASAVYADGSPRSTGSAYAWSPVRETVSGSTQAVYCIPPTSGNALNQRVIFAGATGTGALSPSPTMLRDTYTGNSIYAGISKFSAVYTGWNQSSPFVTGVFGGYTQLLCSGSVKGGQLDYINIWESPETFMIQCLSTPDTTYNSAITNGMAYCGALCDPESSNIIVDAETDGRLYGISMGGNQSGIGNAGNILYTGQSFGATNPSATTSYFYSWNTTVATTISSPQLFYCLVPGSGAFGSQALFGAAFNTAFSATGALTITRSNSRGQVPILAMNNRPATFSPNFVNPSFLGRVRETDMCLGYLSNDIVVRDSGNNVLGYSISTSRNLSTSTALFLPYA
jgi:hypothetical protein